MFVFVEVWLEAEENVDHVDANLFAATYPR